MSPLCDDLSVPFGKVGNGGLETVSYPLLLILLSSCTVMRTILTCMQISFLHQLEHHFPGLYLWVQ